MEYSFTVLFWKVRNIRIVIQFHSMMLNILPEMGQILIITNCSQKSRITTKKPKKICALATCGLWLHKTYGSKIIFKDIFKVQTRFGFLWWILAVVASQFKFPWPLLSCHFHPSISVETALSETGVQSPYT